MWDIFRELNAISLCEQRDAMVADRGNMERAAVQCHLGQFNLGVRVPAPKLVNLGAAWNQESPLLRRTRKLSFLTVRRTLK